MKNSYITFWFSALSVQLERFSSHGLMLLIIFQFAFIYGMFAQDPNLPPSGNFDLTKWKITLPDQSEVKEQELSNGFESPNEFYTDPTTGAMVFRCPNDGATGGSTYPRSELREMLRAGNTSISTTGVGPNNWVFSSSSQAIQDASGAVDGTMTATVAVDHVSTTGESRMIGRVIIGQIHGSNDEPCRIYYRKLPGNTNGSIYIAHEPITGAEQWYEMIGSRSSSASNPADGIPLGEQFSYEIRVVEHTLTVTIMRPGKPDVEQIVDMSASGYEDDWMYFKAGAYNQNNSGNAGEYVQVSFFELNVSHSDDPMVLHLENESELLETRSEVSTYPNPFSDKTTIEYHLSKPAHVNLVIYSLSGKKIDVLINQFQSSLNQKVGWQPEDNLPNGLYFAKLRTGDKTQTFMLVRNR